jgi:broad specificity phosphatase PhoE
MTKYLVLVKHAQPDIVEAAPAREWRLSAQGRVHAGYLAEELARFEPEVIVSSDEPKALETAEIIARKYDLDLQVVEALREHDRSNVPFLPHEAFQRSVQDFFQNADQLVFGRETANQAYTRFYRGVHSILTDHPDKTIVAVAHGTVIALFVARLTGHSDFDLWRMLGLPSYIAIDLESSTLIVRTHIR